MKNDQQSDPSQPTEAQDELSDQSRGMNEEQDSQASNPFDAPTEQATQVDSSEDTPAPVEQSVVPEQAQQPEVAPDQPVVQASQAPTPPVSGQPVPAVSATTPNPGQTLGIVSVVLGLFGLWIVGLPLAIVSMVKSSKANSSKTLGVIGLILNILSAVVVTVAIIVMLLFGVAVLQESGRSEDTIQPDSQTTLSTRDNLISLDAKYMPTNEDVFFAVPASIAGWDMTIIDKEGVNEYIKTDSSAKIMTYQGVLAGGGETDREPTVKAMGEYMTSLEATAIAGTDSTVTFSTISGGSLLEFATKEMTATSDNGNLKGIVAVRMYEGHELAVIYMATTDAFSLTEWNMLISKFKINDGVL